MILSVERAYRRAFQPRYQTWRPSMFSDAVGSSSMAWCKCPILPALLAPVVPMSCQSPSSEMWRSNTCVTLRGTLYAMPIALLLRQSYCCADRGR